MSVTHFYGYCSCFRFIGSYSKPRDKILTVYHEVHPYHPSTNKTTVIRLHQLTFFFLLTCLSNPPEEETNQNKNDLWIHLNVIVMFIVSTRYKTLYLICMKLDKREQRTFLWLDSVLETQIALDGTFYVDDPYRRDSWNFKLTRFMSFSEFSLGLIRLVSLEFQLVTFLLLFPFSSLNFFQLKQIRRRCNQGAN